MIRANARHPAAIRLFLAAIIAIVTVLPLAALDAPEMAGPVNDLAGVMSAQEKEELQSYLTAVNDQTGVQVAVLTVDSLEGDDLEAFSMRVAEKWKLGQADKDNGALLVVAIKERSLRIEVGYGLEGELTDMKSGLIIRNVIVPYFKNGQYGAGIIAGAKNIVGIATGNSSIVANEVSNPPARHDSGSGIAGFVFLVIFLIILAGGMGRRRRGGRVNSGGLIWPFIIGSMLSGSNRHHHDNWGGGFGGGSGFGGGGGGFSGGGGGFGGGGASGGW
jgi:uncharacterized protein